MRLQERFDALGETDNIAVEALEFPIADANDNDGTYFACFVAQFVKQRYDCLFVGKRDVKSSQLGIISQHIW